MGGINDNRKAPSRSFSIRGVHKMGCYDSHDYAGVTKCHIVGTTFHLPPEIHQPGSEGAKWKRI